MHRPCMQERHAQCLPVYAGLPPPPELPLPPGLDSASAMPYQQKAIDLFKAIFEASDSDEEEEEDEAADEKSEPGGPLNGKASAAGTPDNAGPPEESRQSLRE